MTIEKPELKLDCSPVCKARSAHAAKLPITAISLLATPPACPPPQQPNTVNLSSRAGSGGDSFSFSSSVQSGDGGQQLSQWPAPAPSPPAAAKSPSQAGGSPVPAQCTTWKSQAAVVPPPDLKWSPTIERLIMNSTKQIEAIEQTAQQAVTVVLRNMAPLRKLARGAGAPVRRDAYGLHIRLGIRQAATAELMEASSCLLDDLAHLFRLLAGQPSAAGQHGRTSGRHIATIATDLKGAEHQFSEISKELKLAGRFLLVRDPGTGKNPTLDERTVEEGRKDIRQLESVLRGVTSGRNRMHGIWSTLAALQAAGITQDDPSWTLLRGLDISTAADVLASLQLQAKPSLLSEEAAAARRVTDVDMNPEPPTSPGLGRTWWRSSSIGSRRSPSASPSNATAGAGAVRSATAGQQSGCVNGLTDRLAAAGLKNSRSAAAHPHKPVTTATDMPPIQIRPLKHGHVYRGGILKGMKQGLGQLEYSNGCAYDGEFDADEMDGHGVFTFDSGGLYQGQFDMGKYHGSGVETFPSGGTYHGEYASGSRSGNGRCNFANGDVYEGQWEANLRHGLGYQQCPDHSSFCGRYRSGKREGHGCYTFSNGDRYTGEHQNDVPHGSGSYHFASGHTYEGQWLNGSKSGYCVYSLASGQQWAGRWEHGRPVWMQPLAAARAGVESPVGGAKADLVALALAAAAAARRAAEQGAVLLKDHWQQEGGLQAGVRMAVQQAVAAAEAAASIQAQVQAAVSEAVAAVEVAAIAKRKGA